MKIQFEDNGAPLRRSKNRHGETSEEQLRRMCKNIADGITSPCMVTDEETGKIREQYAHEWMEGTYDINYTVDREKRYLGAEILVAGGGPTIWVNLNTREVEGYWGSDRVTYCFNDNLGLDDYFEEMYGC